MSFVSTEKHVGGNADIRFFQHFHKLEETGAAKSINEVPSIISSNLTRCHYLMAIMTPAGFLAGCKARESGGLLTPPLWDPGLKPRLAVADALFQKWYTILGFIGAWLGKTISSNSLHFKFLLAQGLNKKATNGLTADTGLGNSILIKKKMHFLR